MRCGRVPRESEEDRPLQWCAMVLWMILGNWNWRANRGKVLSNSQTGGGEAESNKRICGVSDPQADMTRRIQAECASRYWQLSRRNDVREEG